MKEKNRYICRYLRKLRGFLFAPHRVKKTLMEGFSAELAEYGEAHPQADWGQLVESFGEPEEAAQALSENAGVCESITVRKWKRWALLFGAALAAVLMIYLCVRIVQMHTVTEAVVVETIVVYDEREGKAPMKNTDVQKESLG